MTATLGTMPAADFHAAFIRERAKLLDSFDPKARAWLALLPTWTERLAFACHFPVGADGLERLLTRMETAGLCSRSPPREPDQSGDVEANTPEQETDEQDEAYFWMTAADRLEHIGRLLETPGPVFLRDEAHRIAKAITAVARGGFIPGPSEQFPTTTGGRVFVPKPVEQWADLVVQDLEPTGAAAWLTQKVRELVNNGATGDALDLLAIGKELAPILGGTLEGTVARGNRWVELVYRRIQDERLLKDFVEREEIKDLDRLLETSTPHWALHYVGAGGVGKSMLMRHITSRVAAARNIAVARIDFDHLSPDYPLHRPGQLLSALVDELQSYSASTRQDRLVEDFQQRVLAVHEAISGSGANDLAPEVDSLASIRHPLFESVLGAFCDLLRPLPEPVLLILDTCEELAKLSPSGGMLPSLEAAFEILERTQRKVPSVRVIFAGRRLLALSGERQPDNSPGWQVNEVAMTAKSHLPAFKPYLRIHQLRGFDSDDAAILLRKKSGRDIDAEVRNAVLSRSKEPGAIVPIHRVVPTFSDPADQRYNPFDLALYGDWLRESPQLTAAVINSKTTDPYVEIRIVGRIKHEYVKAVLPAVVLLRRFDKDMMRPAVPAGAALDEVFRELGDMEWINYQRDEALGTVFLEVDRNLYRRLWDYYNAEPRRAELARTRSQIGSALARQIDEKQLRQLSVDHINGALRLLAASEAAAIWDRIERRVPAESDWTWARMVAERLLGEDGAAAFGDVEGSSLEAVPSLRAAVRATHTAAMIQTVADFDARDAWREVASTVSAHPEASIRLWLRCRAELGLVAADLRALTGIFLPTPDAARAAFDVTELEGHRRRVGDASQRLVRHQDELRKLSASGTLEPAYLAQLSGCFAAAFEQALEQAETMIACGHQELAAQIPDLSSSDMTESAIPTPYRDVLAARSAALRGDVNDAQKFSRAVARQAAVSWSRPVPWSDWRAPSSLRDRVRLEILRFLPIPILRQLDARFDKWLAQAANSAEQLKAIDSERLVSAILGLRASWRPPAPAEIRRIIDSERYVFERQPTGFVHRHVCPLFVTLARALTSLGYVDGAIELLEARIEQASGTGSDDLTVRMAQREIARAIRRMRVYGRSTDLLRRLLVSPDAAAVASAWQALVTAGAPGDLRPPEPSPDWPVALVHTCWQCQVGTDADAIAAHRERVLAAWNRGDPAERSQLGLDLMEANLMSTAALRADVPASMLSESDANFVNMEAVLRQSLRRRALAEPGKEIDAEPLELSIPLLAAEVALEEGELLALRLPDRAERLIHFAHHQFKTNGHLAGTLIAAIAGVIAAIRTGESDKASATLKEKVEPAFRDLGAAIPLPTWESIVESSQKMAANDDAGGGGASERSPWTDWLNRLVHAQGLLTVADRRSSDATPDTQNWLARRYSEPWPPEFDLPRPKRRLTWGRVLSVAGTIASVIIALGFVAGVIGGIVWLATSGLSALQQASGANGSIVVGILIGGVVGIGLLGGLIEMTQSFIESLRASWSSVRLHIGFRSSKRPSSRIGTISSTAAVVWRLSKRTLTKAPFWLRFEVNRSSRDESEDPPSVLVGLHLGLPFRWEPMVQFEATGTAPAMQSYAAMASNVPADLVKEFADLMPKLRRLSLQVALEIAPDLSELPWEALLAAALDQAPSEKLGKSPPLITALQPWRCGDPLPGVQRAATDAVAELTEVRVVTRDWRQIADAGWKEIGLPVSIDIVGRDQPERGHLLHLIGSIVESSAGRHLRMDSTVSDRTVERLRLTSDGFKAPSLVIVQGDPVDSMWRADETPLARLDTERERTAALRAYAADLFAAGAWAVIVLPGLPPDLSKKLIAIIAEELRKGAIRRPRSKVSDSEPGDVAPEKSADDDPARSSAETVLVISRDKLLRAVTSVRQTIDGWPVPDWAKEARSELAFDVCVFARYASTVLGKAPSRKRKKQEE
jgi:hypothetical protein